MGMEGVKSIRILALAVIVCSLAPYLRLAACHVCACMSKGLALG